MLDLIDYTSTQFTYFSFRILVVLRTERPSSTVVPMKNLAVPSNETERRRANERLPQIVKREERTKNKFRRRDSSSDESTGKPVKELVKEDVYLMENKVQRINANLLANSLTARLRQSIPENVNVNQSAMNKLRRDSLKELVYLDNLNKQYANEMNWESNRLDKESFQVMKRHNHMKKHSEHQKKNQEKLESQMRTRSGFSSVTLLPRLVDSSASTLESPIRQKTKEDFSEFAFVDKEDQSFVKVFKFNGVFQLQNKYGSRNDLDLQLKTGGASQDQNDESDSPIDLPFKSKSRKGLSVTWSQSQYYSNTDVNSDRDSKSPTRTDTRTGNVSSMSREDQTRTPAPSRARVKRDSYMWSKPIYSKGKSKVDAIGVKWNVPAEESIRRADMESRLERRAPSRKLVPVTEALDREGMSPSRLRWTVQPIQSPSTKMMYKSWVEKIEDLKRTPGLPKSPDMKPKPGRAKMSIISVPV